MKKNILLGVMSIIMLSCGKKTCTCTEHQSSHDTDVANQVMGSDAKRAEFTFTIGQSVMNQDGTIEKYTEEYIEQQKAELEATGKFFCKWSY